jgi:hypothetical protein
MCYKNNRLRSHYNITCNKFTLNVTITTTKISFYNSGSSHMIANMLIIESLYNH